MSGLVQTEKRRRTGASRFVVSRGTAIWLIVMVAAAALVYVGISAYMADKLTRPDRKPLVTTPAAYGLKFEDVEFPSASDGIPLKGWLIDSTGSKTIIMMHGRNGTREDKDIGMLDVASALVQRGYDVLTFDFRAHGESGGVRYSLGQWEVQDVTGALNFLKARGVTEIGAIGYSMGAATELLAAPDHPEIKAIVADAPFADLSRLLDVQLPKSSGLPGIFNPGVVTAGKIMYGIDLLENKPERAVARLANRPLLLIHGASDELIPVEHAYELQKLEAGNPNFESWIVPGSQHVKSFKDYPDEYLYRVVAFFDRNLP